jgi:SAM-dependent methyltransferase
MLHGPSIDREPAVTSTAAPLYRCPIDHGILDCAAGTLTCQACGTVFPVVNGIPVLINDANSVFRRDDFTAANAYTGASGYGGAADASSGFKRAYRTFARRLSEARIPGTAAIDRLYALLEADAGSRILVIGAGERVSRPGTIRTDVAFAANVDCICDAHDLPFEDGAFDVVYAESVLEHVCDPQRCVAEMTRVLCPTGRVLAVTPFLQPVHMGAYDFTRFTYLGHRRLFRMYDEIGSGLCGGPAYAAIHILRNAVIGLTDNRRARAILRLIMLLLTYPWRYLDPWLSRTESAYNASSAFYFCGSKRTTPIPDREILRSFRGA